MASRGVRTRRERGTLELAFTTVVLETVMVVETRLGRWLHG